MYHILSLADVHTVVAKLLWHDVMLWHRLINTVLLSFQLAFFEQRATHHLTP
jgi:hypothetical protein